MLITKFILRWISFFVGILLSIYVLFYWLIGFFRGPRTFFTRKKRDIMPACVNNPDFGTHGFVHLEDVRIHYVAQGLDSKPLMLMLHGFPAFWYSWHYQLIEFKNDYRVVAIDMRGYGESDKPSGMHNYSVTKLLGDLKQLVPALGYRSCVLVGHDWGGLIAWAFASNFPDMVDKLIVMNSPHPKYFKRYLWKYISQFKKSWYIFFFQVPLIPEVTIRLKDYELIEKIFCEDSVTNVTHDDIEAYKYNIARHGGLTAAINYYRAAVVYPHSRLPTVTCPVLTIWGCNDKFLEREMVAHYARKLTDHKVKFLEIGSHWVQTDIPASVNRCMREWLTNY